MQRIFRPNDYFMEQIVELDNDLRKEREHGIPRSIQLAGLCQLGSLPKPWHYEFWSEDIEEDLPFELCHMSHEVQVISSNSQRASMMSSGSADWEWEYYSQTEEDCSAEE